MAYLKTVFFNAFLIGCVVYSTWSLVWEVRELYFMRQSQHWPKIAGTITKSQVRPDGGYYRWPSIVYHFSLNGTSYQSSKVLFGDTLGSHSTAVALRARFPVGRTIDVAYNPTNPAMSCLIPGGALYWETLAALFLYTGFILVGVIVLLDDYKGSARKST